MTRVSNPLLVSSNNNFTVYKTGSTYYAMTKTGIVTKSDNAATLIQDCIDNLTVGRTWKEKVLLRGNFEIDKAIGIDDYTILQLDGKVTLADKADVDLLTGTGKSNFEIVGGEWDGNKAKQTATVEQTGFELTACNDFTVDSLTVHDVHEATSGASKGGYGIALYGGCSKGVVKNCTVHDCGDIATGVEGIGIMLIHASDCQVKGNVLHDNVMGIELYGYSPFAYADRNIISGNLVYNTYDTGIALTRGSGAGHMQWNVVNGNIMYDCGAGGAGLHIVIGTIGATTVDYNICANNVIYETVGASYGGILVNGKYNAIGGNVLYNVRDHGIYIVNGEGNVVTWNTIDANSAYGIRLTDTSYNIINNNHISNVTNGIVLVKSASNESYNLIQGNIIDDPTTNWLIISEAASTGNRVENNEFVGVSGGGAPPFVVDSGTDTKFNNNTGWVTEAAGVATMLLGFNNVDVNHTLSDTPTKVLVTGSTADTNQLYVDSKGTVTFTIHAPGAVGANRDIPWFAKV